MGTIPAIYAKIKSHFHNHYPGTSYAYMSQGLSDALDVACAIMGITPAQFWIYQGAYNDNGPLNSAGYHGKANAFDFDIYATAGATNTWIKVFSYIGIGGWLRDSSKAHGHMLPRHFHGFCLFQGNTKYVDDGIIKQENDYYDGGDGLDNGRGRDDHASFRPTLKGVHFLGKAPSKKATVTKDTHSYKQPGKLADQQDTVRRKGFPITTAVGIVRVWRLDSHGNTIPESSIDMLVTDGLRFYDLDNVKFAA